MIPRRRGPPGSGALRLPHWSDSTPAGPSASPRAGRARAACYGRGVAPPIGFALLTHAHPSQVARLVDRLRHLYGRSVPIAIHHDQRQCSLDPALVEGARLVQPSLSTAWGTWSLVEATLAAVRLLHSADPPDFTVLLSGADYPCAPAERVLGDLVSGGADAYTRAHPVRPWRRDRTARPGPLGFGANEGAPNQEICYRRYYSTTLRWRGLRYRIRSPLLAPLLAPFSARFRAFAGEQWWTLSRKAVDALLDFPARAPRLVRWFAERPIPDEAFVQTVVANAEGVRVAFRNFRYLHWTDTPGPRLLRSDDVPRIAQSGAHFARKFAPDDPALDLLDELLGLPAWAPAQPAATSIRAASGPAQR